MAIMKTIDRNFWNGKRVFLTGHTGFKGSWISLLLQDMGAIVKGFALEAPTNPALFTLASVAANMESEIGDIRDFNSVEKSIVRFNPDVLIHMAAQPLVRLSYKEPLETYAVNVMGTANVLEAAKGCENLKAIVSITTDKCYENKEWPWGYRENEAMGGHDPYSSSKGCAELVISAYQRSFFNKPGEPALASARAGNVIGGGDWASDRLIPDILNAFGKGEKVIVRNPLAIRPWQHVLEPLNGYLMLAEKLYKEGQTFAEGWNFGPKDEDCKSVEWILNTLISKWTGDAAWELDEDANPHEATFLKLDCSKAGVMLDWQPRWNAEQTITRIVNWHNAWKNNEDMHQYCLNEIASYNKD
jgi:CDP-glucose 4,6-dehydratase